MTTLVLYALLTTSACYFFGLSKIFEPVRVHLPGGVVDWLLCPFCSGFWYGVVVGVLGALARVDFMGLAAASDHPNTVRGLEPLVVGIGAMIWTPLLLAYVLRGYAYYARFLHGTAEPEGDRTADAGAPTPEPDPPDTRRV
jgi:hypothetical protein